MSQNTLQSPSRMDDSLFLSSTCLFVVIAMALIVLGFFRIVPGEILSSIFKGTILILLTERVGDFLRQRFIGRHKGLVSNFIGGTLILIVAAIMATLALLWGVSLSGSFNDPLWNAVQDTVFLLVGIAGIGWTQRFRHLRLRIDVQKTSGLDQP